MARARCSLDRARWGWLGSMALLALTACGGAGPATHEPKLESTRAAAEPTWLFHPQQAAVVLSSLELGPSERLEVDAAGSRWLVRASSSPEAAPYGAPEPLFGVRRTSDGFLSVGRSGAAYLSKEPLGPFVETRLPPETFVDTTLVGDTVVALGKSGSFWRSETAGREWRRADSPAFLVDVATRRDSELFAFAAPESWFSSLDAGKSWKRVETPTMAPEKLIERRDGRLGVSTVFGDFEWTGSQFVRASAEQRAAENRPVPPFAGASAITRGVAATSGELFFGLARPKTDGPWEIASGTIREPLTKRAEPLFDDCGEVRVVAARRFVHVLCQPRQASGVAPLLALWSSSDRGATFRHNPVVVRGLLRDVVVAAAHDGRLALSGVCSPRSNEPGCSPRGLHFLDFEAKKATPVPFVELDRFDQLAFGARGDLWALARRSDQHVLLYRVARERPDALSWSRDLDEDLLRGAGAAKDEVHLFVGADESATALVGLGGRRVLLRVDARGQLTSHGEAPSGVDVVSGFGERLGAVDSRAGLFWESTNAGLGWTKQKAPRALCGADVRTCRVSLFCASWGCLVGDELTRVGWGEGLAAPGADTLERSKGAARSRPRGAPYECRALGDVEEDLSLLEAVPSALDAGLGDVAWVQVETRPEVGAATAVHARFDSPRLERHELFAPLPAGRRFAFSVMGQIEGSAVLRYSLPRSVADRMVTDVEVAWDNRIAGVLGRGRLSGEFQPEPGDFESTGLSFERARPALLSVAGRGLFLRLHSRRDRTQPVYYFENATVRSLSSPPWPAVSGEWEDEFIRVEGKDVPVAWARSGRVVVRDNPSKTGDFRPFLLTPLDAEARGLVVTTGLAYVGSRPALYTLVADREETFTRAFVAPFGVDSPFETAISSPLQEDLPPSPRPCTTEERASTPRLVTPGLLGPEHVILVTGATGASSQFRTERAVVQGRVSSPCAVAFDAESTTSDTTTRERVLLVVGEGKVSWLFREERSPSAPRKISARPLQCALAQLE